jgi:hypothetical protein
LSSDSEEGRPRIYLDTSAYIEILLDDKRAAFLRKQLSGARLLSSVLLILETRRNLVRLARQEIIDAGKYADCVSQVEADIERFDLRDLTLDLCGIGPLPPVSMPRSLDVAHLRAALWFHQQSPIERFVTLDTRQEQAAKELGLPV